MTFMGRNKLDRIRFPGCKVKPETVVLLRELAIELGYTYGSGASTGELLDTIATLDRDLLKLIIFKSAKLNQ